MRLSARPRFLAVADTEHGTELGSAPNDRGTGAHEGAIPPAPAAAGQQ